MASADTTIRTIRAWQERLITTAEAMENIGAETVSELLAAERTYGPRESRTLGTLDGLHPGRKLLRGAANGSRQLAGRDDRFNLYRR